ncbi:MAG: phosphate ABC transporter permease subunit PstC [Chloroflexota bacterium]|nr:phosphate ABC transporter permease subunit PstC [Chloroflexota bacterium]
MTSRTADRTFAASVTALALMVPLTLAGITLLIVLDSLPSLQRFGLDFLVTSRWDPVHAIFGAGAYLFGTLVTTAIAIVLATPIAVGAAIFLTEYAPRVIRGPLSFLIELLAYIPSIVYGLWGLFVLVPLFRSEIDPFLQRTVGQVPVIGALFSGSIVGTDLLMGGVILAVMVLPLLVAVIREVLLAVPPAQREGMIGLGATRWEAIAGAVLPYARTGIIGAVVLGVARAFGETMAVTLVAGNSSTTIGPSLFTPGYTMASAIANQFTEASDPLHFSALVEISLVLLVVALVINTAARLLIRRVASGPQGLVI